MQDFQFVVSAGILVGFGLLEIVRGRFFTPLATREDNRLDLAVTVLFPVISISVLFASMTLAAKLFPDARDAWAHWPWYAMVGTLLIADDLTQYWWHRLSHTSFLWPLHRAHHSAAYMSVRIVYRNNAFYYAMMPGLWLSGLLIYLGFGFVYVGYAIVKLAVIIGAHSSVRWDEKLYSIPALSPLMWVIERTISTPATHYAHHALSQDDGIGHYRGNYGNLLFLWDMIFRTAVITRRYPPAFGLSDDRQHGPERWWTQFLYPIFRSRRAVSSLSVPPATAPP
jgi:sterol desaturase/sphingolipid hydroxylase (fatty acid hydroxylase superfamily)